MIKCNNNFLIPMGGKMAETKKTGTSKTSTKTNSKASSKTTRKSSGSRSKSKSKTTTIRIGFKGIIAILIVAALALTYLYFFQRPIFDNLKNRYLNPQTAEAQGSMDSVENANAQGQNQNVVVQTGDQTAYFWNAAENDPMFFGNPNAAALFDANKVPDENSVSAKSMIFVKPQFTLSYNAEKLIPNWVMWHLDNSDFGDAERGDDFRPDDGLPSSWYAVTKADYQYTKYGFDRGHVCPSADRTKTQGDNSNTFYMSNMIPQAPDCNRVLWKDLESYERRLAESGRELYIAAGPHGVGGQSGTGEWSEIELISKNSKKADGSPRKIEVPAYCWKVVLVLDQGSGDLSRVTKDTPVIAVYMPNRQGIAKIDGKSVGWDAYLTTVDDIEAKTGYDFFANLPDDIEETIESKKFQMIPVK